MGWGLNTPDFAKLLQPVPVVFLTYLSQHRITSDLFELVSYGLRLNWRSAVVTLARKAVRHRLASSHA